MFVFPFSDLPCTTGTVAGVSSPALYANFLDEFAGK